MKPKLNHLPHIFITLAIILNIIARLSISFSNFYVTHIYPLIVTSYGRIANLFHYSVGEIMLYTAFFLILLLFIGGITCIFRLGTIRKKTTQKKTPRKLFTKIYLTYIKICLWLAATFFLIMTLNCFIQFHCSPITEFYQIGNKQTHETRETQEYGLEELRKLRNHIVENANDLATKLTRDEHGYLIYKGDMVSKAQDEMQRLGEKYGRLKGFYPRPKPFQLSNFFSQQYISGYYFPFSLEANYNNSMYIINKPSTMCHELAHVKGFMYEDEANFIAYLACAYSEDDFFRYSGYLSVINYLERDFITAIGNNPTFYHEQPQISELVRRDNIFLTPEAWRQVEENAVFSTEFVRDISKEIIEVNLAINGVSDGILSYGRVVGLLLMYYDGVLY